MDITLYVYIIGLSNRSFPVTIANSDTVGLLAEAILKKNPNDLKNVDAHRLDLYKVSFPDDATLKQSVRQPLDHKLDAGSEELSQLFPINPPARTVSIIVDIQGVGE
jgi:hypothetical protein